MMMAIKPNAGVMVGLAELGTAGGPEAGADGEDFMALMATLTVTPDGDSAAPATVGAEDGAKQMIAMITGAAVTAKPGQAASPTQESKKEEGSEGDAETADADGSDTPAVPVADAQAAVPGTATAVPAAPVIEIKPAAAKELASAKSAAPTPAASPVTVLGGLTATAPATQGTMPPPPTVDIGKEAAAVVITPAAAAGPVNQADAPVAPAPAPAPAAAAPAAAAEIAAAAAPTLLPSLMQLGIAALPKAGTGLAKDVYHGRGEAAPAAANDSKSAAPAPNFLVSTILPLLPESLHALVLGQNSQADAAAGASNMTRPLDTGQQMIEQHLDLAHEGEWLDRLAKDIARSAGNEGGLRFRLNPENLGGLHVEVVHGAHGASIRMTTDTEAARTIIADAQPKLVAEARANGLRIAESHVDLGAGSQPGSGDPRRQGNLQQQQPFVRTAAAEPAAAPARPQRAPSAAERYA